MEQIQHQAAPQWPALAESRSAVTVLRTVEAIQLAEITLKLAQIQAELSAALGQARAAG